MRYVIGALAGLIWGVAAALINAGISKKCMEKNSAGAMMGANAARFAIDLTALGLIFLLRKVLPFSYEAALVGTAVAMSVVTIVTAFQMARPK